MHQTPATSHESKQKLMKASVSSQTGRGTPPATCAHLDRCRRQQQADFGGELWHDNKINCTTKEKFISHCVWLYYRFSLSYRDIELMMAERGLSLTYETIRYWCLKFGHLYAKQMRKRKVWGDTWHLDEVFCRINGQVHYLWRAVDQDGQVLDILVQRKRNKPAADRFFRKLKKQGYSPRSIVTDKLASYRAPRKVHFPLTRHIAQNPLSA